MTIHPCSLIRLKRGTYWDDARGTLQPVHDGVAIVIATSYGFETILIRILTRDGSILQRVFNTDIDPYAQRRIYERIA